MKKQKLILAAITLLIFLAGLIHTLVCFINILNDPYTGAPASVALLWAIPYLLAIAVCLTVGLIVIRKKRN